MSILWWIFFVEGHAMFIKDIVNVSLFKLQSQQTHKKQRANIQKSRGKVAVMHEI